MKKIIALPYLPFFLYILAIYPLCLAQETLQIDTYFPAPYGAYNEINATGRVLLATERDNVGIGTTNPDSGALLHVYNVSTTDPTQMLIQNAGTRSAIVRITSNTGQWNLMVPGSADSNRGDFIIQQGGTNRIYINNTTGGVGIGRSNSAAIQPSLDVANVWLRDANGGSGSWATNITLSGSINTTRNSTGVQNQTLMCPSPTYVCGGITGPGSHRMWDLEGIICCNP